ncbi:MAG: DUF6134 family protein [Ferrovibrio sp.]
MLTALPFQAWPQQLPVAETYEFQVLRNGTPIGHHRVTVRGDGTRSDVDIDIQLHVKVAGFLTLYRYLHQSHETWIGDRLVSLHSTTDNDGDQEYLNAEAMDGVLRVDGSGFRGVLPADTMPSSYWRSDFVRRGTLMNTQNGRRMEMEIRPERYELASAANGELPARRYHLTGDYDLTLWYSADGRWVKLAFPAKDGSQIEYLLK